MNPVCNQRLCLQCFGEIGHWSKRYENDRVFFSFHDFFRYERNSPVFDGNVVFTRQRRINDITHAIVTVNKSSATVFVASERFCLTKIHRNLCSIDHLQYSRSIGSELRHTCFTGQIAMNNGDCDDVQVLSKTKKQRHCIIDSWITVNNNYFVLLHAEPLQIQRCLTPRHTIDSEFEISNRIRCFFQFIGMGNQQVTLGDNLKDALGLNFHDDKDSKLTADESKVRRIKVCQEILDTEKTYTELLGVLYEDFQLPMTKEHIRKPEQIKEIFSVTETLYGLHKEFLKKLGGNAKNASSTLLHLRYIKRAVGTSAEK